MDGWITGGVRHVSGPGDPALTSSLVLLLLLLLLLLGWVAIREKIHYIRTEGPPGVEKLSCDADLVILLRYSIDHMTTLHGYKQHNIHSLLVYNLLCYAVVVDCEA